VILRLCRTFFQGLCVLGYCILPLVLASVLLRALSAVALHLAWRVILVASATGWSIYGASRPRA
jgi:hypothetical protein